MGFPLLVLAGCALADVLLLRQWRASLPEPLATHFDGSGRPNEFMSWDANLITSMLFTTGLPLILLATLSLVGRGQLRRFGATLSSGMAVFITVGSLASVAGQRGLQDAHDARMSGVGMGLAAAAGAITAGLAFWIAPPAAGGPRPSSADLPRLALRPGERAVWTSHDTSRVVLVVAGVLAVAGTVVSVVLRDLAFAGILVGTALLTASLAWVRARVDRSGLTWRMGPIHRRIPLSRITSARAVEVDPMEYGGWGYRLSGNGQAIVTRRGPGLRITREGACDLTVTVPDAHTGAALLNTLLERARVESAQNSLDGPGSR